MTTNNKIKDYIKNIPKAELHLHLEGMITEDIENKFIQHMQCFDLKPSNLDPFAIFNYRLEKLCDIKNFEYNIDLLIKYMIETREQQNIYYTQFTYSALKIHSVKKLSVVDQFDIIINSIKKYLKEGYYIDFILDIPRGNANIYTYFSEGKYLDDIIICKQKYPNYIAGVGIGGRIESNTVDTYINFFEKAQKNKLKIIPHAGEFGNPNTICNSINTAIKYSNRLGHGVRIDECKNQFDTNNLTLDICITSNTIFIDDVKYTIDTHPIKDLIKKNNYNITLSTDDPGILYKKDLEENIDLNYEYELLTKIFKGLDKQLYIITLIAYNGFDVVEKENQDNDELLKIVKDNKNKIIEEFKKFILSYSEIDGDNYKDKNGKLYNKINVDECLNKVFTNNKLKGVIIKLLN